MAATTNHKMEANQDPRAGFIREALKELALCDRLRNDEAEERMDAVMVEFNQLPREGLVDLVAAVAGKNKSRRGAMVYLLAELGDDPAALKYIEAELQSGDENSRGILVQTIGKKKLLKLAPVLNEIMVNDSDEFCRGMAIHAASKLKSDENFPTILKLARRSSVPLDWRLLQALSAFGRVEGAPFLEASFSHPDISKEDRVWAAWGLGKLESAEAIEFLKAALYDPDVTLPNGYRPGVSIHAAQALCDIKGWPFEWSKNFVEANRDGWVKAV